jgi:phosphoribosylformimino-5-aminoimidazole carboxamide ribotide isomerase
MRRRGFRILPVLDVQRGEAVHAVGGHRSHYRPLRSRLHPSADPTGVARACRDELGLTELYVADLDAITGGLPQRDLLLRLHGLGLCLWIDAGVKSARDLALFDRLPGATIVIGLETLTGPGALLGILEEVGPDRVVLSLDLFEGVPIVATGADWGTTEPLQLASLALDMGLKRLLLLDLARVGTGRGTGSNALLASLRGARKDLEMSIGGGVASLEETRELQEIGADVVLIGSAFHDGRLTREHLDRP